MKRSKNTHGVVNFPIGEDGYKDTGEGGLAVYASWWDVPNEVCQSGAEGRIIYDVLLSDPKVSDKIYLSYEDGTVSEHGFGCAYTSSYVYLGSTSASLWNGEEYFQAAYEDLTEEAQRLIDTLSDLIGDRPQLLTFLDT